MEPIEGFEAPVLPRLIVRDTQPDDLSWSEVGEMAYGYLRIPFALVIVEIVYWWATDPMATIEPYQSLLATTWVSISNILWPGSAELVFHGPSQALTGVNLFDENFQGGFERLFVSDECSGMHEIVFLGVLMMLTPGVEKRIRMKSIAYMVVLVQFLNLVRLLSLYPIAKNSGPDQMFAFHEFILSTGFLAILVVIWLCWYLYLDRRGLIDHMQKPSLSDLKKYRNIELRKKLPITSVLTIIFCLLVASWATYEVTYNDENLQFRGTAESCEYDEDAGAWLDSTNSNCYAKKIIWDDVVRRSAISWLFSAVFIAASIVCIVDDESDESE